MKLKKRLEDLEGRAPCSHASTEGSQPAEPHPLPQSSCSKLLSSDPHQSQYTSLQERNIVHSLPCSPQRSISPMVTPSSRSAPVHPASEPLAWAALPCQPLHTPHHLPASSSCPTTPLPVEQPPEYESYIHQHSSPFNEGYAAMAGYSTDGTGS
jgi:hypothetical protein